MPVRAVIEFTRSAPLTQVAEPPGVFEPLGPRFECLKVSLSKESPWVACVRVPVRVERTK